MVIKKKTAISNLLENKQDATAQEYLTKMIWKEEVPNIIFNAKIRIDQNYRIY